MQSAAASPKIIRPMLSILTEVCLKRNEEVRCDSNQNTRVTKLPTIFCRYRMMVRRRELLRRLVLLFALTKVPASYAKADPGFVDMTPEAEEEDEKEKEEQEKADQALDSENHPPEEDESEREPASEDDSDSDSSDKAGSK